MNTVKNMINMFYIKMNNMQLIYQMEPHPTIYSDCVKLAYEDSDATYYKSFIANCKRLGIKSDADMKKYLDYHSHTILSMREYYDDEEMSKDKDVLNVVVAEYLWSFWLIYTQMANFLITLHEMYDRMSFNEIDYNSDIFDEIDDICITRSSLLRWESAYDEKVLSLEARGRANAEILYAQIMLIE
jgi:hypothetical protein